MERLRFIKTYNIIIPNIIIGLHILLTAAISSTGCGRKFSKLKLRKFYLRSLMSQLRLSNLALLSIEHELSANNDTASALNEFALVKAR